MDVLDAEHLRLQCDARGVESRHDHVGRRAVQAQLLLHARQSRRLLEPADAPELRFSDRLPEEQLQRDGGRQLLAYAEHAGRRRWTPTDSSRAASAMTRAISATTSTRCWAAIFPKTWTSRSRGTAPTTKRPTRWASQVPKTATSTTGRRAT